MNARRYIFAMVLLLGSFRTQGQGTIQFDQQSGTSPGFEGGYDIQSTQPIGQSFTPSLNSIGVVQLYIQSENAASADVYLNLLANSITGPVLGQTLTVTVPANSAQIVNLYFPTPVGLSPGTTYYFQPEVASGAAIANVGILYHYSGGTSFINGTADPTRNFYFREGIVIPEPSTWALLILGGGSLLLRKRLGVSRLRKN